MKLIITIPAYNEEKAISSVIKTIPKKIKGISTVKVLVFNDGSEDNTAKEAKKAKADYIFNNKKNLGLARTFNKAVIKALDLGADIIVNTDADNQYKQQEIPSLIQPILRGEADMVIGNRQVAKLNHMPFFNKYGNIICSWFFRSVAGNNVTDVSSGFRAFTREVAQSINLLSDHTYTHETIIQAFNNGFAVTEIPITFRKREYGKSRLISGILPHINKSFSAIVRTILIYKAFKYIVTAGILIMLIGILGGLRFLYFYFNGEGNGHTQSLILSSIFISIGFTTVQMGVIADLIVTNRRLLEKYGS